MTLRQDPRSRTRTRTRTGIPATRRRSPCYRHPEEPITGFCASCLRERLYGLDVSATPNVASPELRRCRSVVSASKCEGPSSNSHEPRRKSCDVISGRSSLSTLFDADDQRSGLETDVKVDSKNAGLARVTYNVIESENRKRDEIRVLGDRLEGLNVECVDGDVETEDGEFKTMKEYIDLEFQNKTKKSKDLREMAGNLLGAASVVSRKLLKWRQKNNETKKPDNSRESKNTLRDNHPQIVGRRRSCDAGQTFSVDAGRISLEEPRASWDGYIIARTIPRLAPMFSAVETGMLGNINRFEKHRLSVDGAMHSIMEDESSSGASGSGQSNSDSSSSLRGSSFDLSSSVRSCGKKVMTSEDSGASPVNDKLVITEKELKDWHLSSAGAADNSEKPGCISRNTAATQVVSNLDAPVQKSVRCRVRNIFGLRAKNFNNAGETMASDDANKTAQVKEDGRNLPDIGCLKLGRSSLDGDSISSCGAIESNYSRRSIDAAGGYAFKGHEDFKLERSKSAKYSPAHVHTGARPFYMTPLRSLKNSKSGKFKLQDSHSIVGHTLQLD